MRETHLRSIIKGVTWRAVATMTTFVLVWIFTGNLVLSLELGFFEVVLKLFFYYLHERGWDHVTWGKY